MTSYHVYQWDLGYRPRLGRIVYGWKFWTSWPQRFTKTTGWRFDSKGCWKTLRKAEYALAKYLDGANRYNTSQEGKANETT